MKKSDRAKLRKIIDELNFIATDSEASNIRLCLVDAMVSIQEAVYMSEEE